MKRIGRRPFLLSAVVLAACGGKVVADSAFVATPAPPDPPFVPPFDDFGRDAQVQPDRPTECLDRSPATPLRALVGMLSIGPYPRTLYSWTTAEQVAGLRASDPLFTKSTTDSGHRGLLFSVLEKRAATGDATAKWLAGPDFALGRFAWPFLAGTRVSPERYGDEIVAITLKKEAIFVAFSASLGSYTFVDTDGKLVPDDVVKANPERVAAFFFMNDQNTSSSTSGPQCLGTIEVGLIYREFYLGNLGMIEEWSLRTPDIATRLVNEIAELRDLGQSLDCTLGRIGPSCDVVLYKWQRKPASRADQLVTSLAFASPFGRTGLMPADLTRLAADLDRLDRRVDPFVVRP